MSGDHGVYRPGDPRYAEYVRRGILRELTCAVCGGLFATKPTKERTRRTCSPECSMRLHGSRVTDQRWGGRSTA